MSTKMHAFVCHVNNVSSRRLLSAYDRVVAASKPSADEALDVVLAVSPLVIEF